MKTIKKLTTLSLLIILFSSCSVRRHNQAIKHGHGGNYSCYGGSF